MVKCDGCPLYAYREEGDGDDFAFWKECCLTGCDENEDKDGSCPLLEIKLKDGTVFKPEVVGD